ncbi:MAG: Por secretion system C-terminal sorting protein [Chlorobi bacterium]|nr:Por secretion system C-terminal sorting protein [Chlorobiota bacterium]
MRRDSNNILIPDDRFPYGMEELPLKGAWHNRFETISDHMRDHDSLSLLFDDPVYTGDAVAVADSLVRIDSSRAGWVRDYMLSLAGSFGDSVYGGGSVIVPVAASVPSRADRGFALEQNIPNPFAGTTTIRYAIGADGPVRLEIYNAAGTLVMMPVDKIQTRGDYVIGVNLKELPQGIYHYRLTSGDFSSTRMMTVVRQRSTEP